MVDDSGRVFNSFGKLAIFDIVKPFVLVYTSDVNGRACNPVRRLVICGIVKAQSLMRFCLVLKSALVSALEYTSTFDTDLIYIFIYTCPSAATGIAPGYPTLKSARSNVHSVAELF